MSILFGHPTGTPFSHHAALAHLEADRLDAFCVAWMPSRFSLRLLQMAGSVLPKAKRLTRRHFPPLVDTPTVQDRFGEWKRLTMRVMGCSEERLAYEANDWLMRAMSSECRRETVTALHAYEDCSLWQFEAAKRLGKACIYDMPIGYYPAWERTQDELARTYAAWVPSGGLASSRYVRTEQKRREIELADLTLVPSSFVEKTIRPFHPGKKLALAPFGVDLDFWVGEEDTTDDRPLRFICAGQLSIRKGTPILLEAWEKAALRDAELELVGPWLLVEEKLASLPRGVVWRGPCSSEELREHYRSADIFVFPSFFEGFGLVLLEAMACGLPAIASEATAGPDVLTDACGRLVPSGNVEALVDSLKWFADHRNRLPAMSQAARAQAERYSWENYRCRVKEAVAQFV